jgi:hypothetical protein
MPSGYLAECSFLIPLTRDSVLSDGLKHETSAWEWLETELDIRFEGFTEAPGYYRGSYRDPDTGERVNDESKQYVVALDLNRIEELRELLSIACDTFQQKCIYLSIAGQVEFVRKNES